MGTSAVFSPLDGEGSTGTRSEVAGRSRSFYVRAAVCPEVDRSSSAQLVLTGA